MIEWIRGTFPTWSFYLLGPVLLLALSAAIRRGLSVFAGPPKATLWGVVIAVGLLLPGHQRGGGGWVGLAVMAGSAVAALGVGVWLDRRADPEA